MTSYSPRVTTTRLPDYSDVQRLVSFPGWRDLPPRDKALAIFRYLAHPDTGLYPIQGIYEDPDPGPEYVFYDERDLMKVLNVHGHGYCGLLSPTLAGILAHAGFEEVRCIRMKENHHCVTEVWYDGGWHYFDLDLRGLLLRADGEVASLAEACRERELWTDPPLEVEPFYPLDDKAAMFESFARCSLKHSYHWHKNGQTSDLVLRPGESLTRFWEGQDSRWFHPWPAAGGFNVDFLRRRFAEEPRGLKCKHPGWSRWGYGNGLFTYAPRLTSECEDFSHGVCDQQGVELTRQGVESPAGGQVSFAVQTPYIIVGRVVEMGPPSVLEGAAVVSYRSLGPLRVMVSSDNGKTWSRVGGLAGPGRGRLDLTPQVVGRYGYRLRFDLEPGSGLAELEVQTWGQVSPPSLPRLFAGQNQLRFSTGDRHGHHTSMDEIRLNLRDPAQLERHLVRLEGEYQPLRDEARIRGEVVLRVDARPGRRIQWLTLGGYFHTHLGDGAADNGNAILYSVAGPEGPWTQVCRPRVPAWVEDWHYGMDGDVVLPEPAETLYVRYVADPGLNQAWVYSHCLEEGAPSPVRVTHGYEIDGKAQESSFVFDRDTDYQIDCDGEPEDRYITFAVDSRPASTGGRQ